VKAPGCRWSIFIRTAPKMPGRPSRKNVTVTQDLDLYRRVKNSMPGRATVRTKDGREYTDEVLYPRGNPGNPRSEAEFKHKFMEMAERVLGNNQAEELYAREIALTDVADVSELAPLFARE
jgi:2-methylcitrate dehydratase